MHIIIIESSVIILENHQNLRYGILFLLEIAFSFSFPLTGNTHHISSLQKFSSFLTVNIILFFNSHIFRVFTKIQVIIYECQLHERQSKISDCFENRCFDII